MNVSPATLGGNSLVTSKITALKAGDFAGLSGVTELDLHDNKITSFSRNMFTGLTSLEKLDLSMNRLDEGNVTLSSDVFAYLTGLKKLNLWDNGLGSLPEGVFDDLTSLEELDVGSNWIVSGLYGDIFKDLSSLKVLKLNGAKAKDNGSRSLHRDLFDGLSNLEELNIGDNKLTSLHEDLFDGLSSLKTLSIRANEITSLPEGIFDDLDSLEYLYLHQNKIAALPDGIFEGLANLYRINMDGNTGAPFAITVTLEQLHNGIDYGDLGLLSTTTLTIPAGETKSNAAENYALNSYYTVQYEIGSLSDWTAKAPDGAYRVKGLNLVAGSGVPAVPRLAMSGITETSYAENSTSSIATFSVAEGVPVYFWSLAGDDKDTLSIDGTEDEETGSIDNAVLTFATPPDFEEPTDSDTDNVYQVTVLASDGTSIAVLVVTVTVTDVDEAPTLTAE